MAKKSNPFTKAQQVKGGKKSPGQGKKSSKKK
jgi:hypothetical protein